MRAKLKLGLLFLLTGIMLLAYMISAYAEDTGISPRLTNLSTSSMHFSVTDNEAEVDVSYNGRSETFLYAKVHVKIEKRFMMFFWNDVTEWTGTNKAVVGHIAQILPADGSGVYRAIITLTVYGTGINDVIEETIETKAG